MKKSTIDLFREKAIRRYLKALDEGDMESVAEVLEISLDDPELERIITEINLAYHEEEQLTPMAIDAQLVRDLIHQHLQSAFTTQEQSQSPDFQALQVQGKPLTVGDVAKRLKQTNLVPLEQEILQHLLESSVPLPKSLSIQAIKQLATQLQIQVSDRFLNSFREAAIKLSMGKSHTQALQAAREQSTRYTSSPNSSKPVKKKTKPENE